MPSGVLQLSEPEGAQTAVGGHVVPQMQGSNSTNLFPKPPVIGNLTGPVRRDTKVQRTPQVILCRANICIENVATVSRGQQLAGEGFGLTQPRARRKVLGRAAACGAHV